MNFRKTIFSSSFQIVIMKSKYELVSTMGSLLKMALVAKTNIELDDLLRAKPKTVIYHPERVEEQPVHNQTQTMERERIRQ